MKNFYHRYSIYLALLITLTLITQCSGNMKVSPTVIGITAIPKPTDAVITPPFILNSTSTPTNILKPTEAPTILTDVKLPTLSPESSKSKILELLRENANCSFPCIWGMIPGSTNQSNLFDFLSQFPPINNPNTYLIQHNYQGIGGFLFFSILENNTKVDVYFLHSEEQDKVNTVALNMMAKKGDKVDFNSPYFVKYFSRYSLAQILTKYGQPTNVLIATWLDDPIIKSEYIPFVLVLSYQEIGMIVEYISDRKIDRDMFIGCPTQSFIQIWTWNPSGNKELKKILEGKSGDGITAKNIDYFQPLEKVTDLTVTDFYKNYVSADYENCIVTPKTHWK